MSAESLASAAAVAVAIRARRSVRGFKSDEIETRELEEIFTLAQWAPSNCNAQPWTPHVVSGEARKHLCAALRGAGERGEPIRPDYQADYKFTGIYRERQIDAAQQLYGALGVERRDLEGRRAAFLANFDGFDAPHAVFVFMDESFGVREAADVGMWAQTLMLILASRGFASCAQGSMSFYPDLVRKHLGVSENERLLFAISFGFEAPESPANAARVGRAALRDAAHFHR